MRGLSGPDFWCIDLRQLPCACSSFVVRGIAWQRGIWQPARAPPRWATDAWAGAREEKGMRWFPGGVGLRFENGAVRIAHRYKAVERRFDDSGDLVDLRFLEE